MRWAATVLTRGPGVGSDNAERPAVRPDARPVETTSGSRGHHMEKSREIAGQRPNFRCPYVTRPGVGFGGSTAFLRVGNELREAGWSATLVAPARDRDPDLADRDAGQCGSDPLDEHLVQVAELTRPFGRVGDDREDAFSQRPDMCALGQHRAHESRPRGCELVDLARLSQAELASPRPRGVADRARWLTHDCLPRLTFSLTTFSITTSR